MYSDQQPDHEEHQYAALPQEGTSPRIPAHSVPEAEPHPSPLAGTVFTDHHTSTPASTAETDRDPTRKPKPFPRQRAVTRTTALTVNSTPAIFPTGCKSNVSWTC